MANPKRLSGGGHISKAGKRPVLLGVTPEQHEKLKRAAAAEHRPMTQFLIHHGLTAAEKILRNSGKNA